MLVLQCSENSFPSLGWVFPSGTAPIVLIVCEDPFSDGAHQVRSVGSSVMLVTTDFADCIRSSIDVTPVAADFNRGRVNPPSPISFKIPSIPSSLLRNLSTSRVDLIFESI
eukprot:GHVH01006852.1.p1 GENE.GHVH01006852.1~~GHVH01006852.1.p1  ORF type:complete len:111 (-),score=3.91 GHVH01006852.1:259-591(-)